MSMTNRMRIVAKNRLHSTPPSGEQKNTFGRNVWKRKEWCVCVGGVVNLTCKGTKVIQMRTDE